MISYLTGPMLGNVKMGVVAERLGTKTAIVSGGILSIIAVLLLAVLLPKFVRYVGRDSVKRKEFEEREWDERNRARTAVQT